MTATDALDIRRKLVGLCRIVQTRSVDSSKAAMNEAQLALNDYGANKDRYDSFRDQLIGRRDMFKGQYQKALSELNVLDMIDLKEPRRTVEFGAIVISDVCWLFVSISAGKIELDGQLYYAISPAVPLYKAMEGFKKGDSFEFNGKKQHIEEVF